jgi:Na+-transporting NADH:ubiquinone oxidoreductase subunit NqrB
VPRYLTIAAMLVALWVLVLAGEVWTSAVPAALVLGTAIADYRLWTARGRPWHDWTVIVVLLPAIAAAVWIAIGGLVVGVERSDAERLLLEVGPGVALTGLLCTLISYHGRHHPDDRPGPADR